LRLTAEQYGYQRGSSLGARYERLILDARAAGCSLSAHCDDTSPTTSQLWSQQETVAEAITQSLDRLAHPEQFALQALQWAEHEASGRHADSFSRLMRFSSATTTSIFARATAAPASFTSSTRWCTTASSSVM
jgi:hypothetical protein